jgi:hypothetical protein
LYGVLFPVGIKGLPFSTSQLTNKGQPTHQPTTNQQKTLANASKPILNAFSRQQSVVALLSLLLLNFSQFAKQGTRHVVLAQVTLMCAKRQMARFFG